MANYGGLRLQNSACDLEKKVNHVALCFETCELTVWSQMLECIHKHWKPKNPTNKYAYQQLLISIMSKAKGYFVRP